MKPPLTPAFDPDAHPIKLRCAGKEVFGFFYPADGTVELVCRATACKRRGITRHLFNPATGLVVDIDDTRSDTRAGRRPAVPPTQQPPRELRGKETG